MFYRQTSIQPFGYFSDKMCKSILVQHMLYYYRYFPLKETCEMEKERPFLVYPVRKPTILREKKELPRDHHRFLFFCLFIINLAALLKIYQSNQYLNKLTVITQNFRSDIDKLAIHHRLLLTKLQQLVRQFNFKDVVKTFNTTSDGT